MNVPDGETKLKTLFGKLMLFKTFFDKSEKEAGVLQEAKVAEFVYQVTRKSCPAGGYAGWLQDGRSTLKG
jgi:hypothetical protein